MEVKKIEVETVVLENGLALTLNKDESRILLGVLGKAKFEDARNYLSSYDIAVDDIENIIYRMYCKIYDTVFGKDFK